MNELKLKGNLRMVLWLCGFALTLKDISADNSTLYFEVQPEDTKVKTGGSVELKCRVHEEDSVIYSWTLDDEVLENTTRRYQNGSNLHITRVSPRYDLGQFKCVARNVTSGHSIVSQAAQLDILWISDTVRVVVEKPSADATPGDEFAIHCRAEANPEADTDWFYNGEKIVADDRISFHANKLVIRDINITDNGIYSCLASNEAGEVRSTENYALKLTGDNGPHILEVPKDKTVPEGSSVLFDCSYENAARVDWYFGNGTEPLQNNTKYLIFPNSSLSISFVDVSDEGIYKCTAVSFAASNIALQTYASHLTVAYIENFTRQTFEPYVHENGVEVPIGGGFEIACVNPRAFPVPRMWWEDPKGHVISDSGRVKVDDMRLVISDIQKSDSGNYTCIAENAAGHARIVFTLTAVEKLKFMPAPVNRNLELGSNAKLYCKAGGASPPTVKWVKLSNLSSEWPAHIRDDNGTLHFNGVLSSDSGKYMCIARNSQGMINTTIDVDVIVMPKFSVHPSDTEAVEGHPAILHCAAVGDPQPTIQWDKNNVLNGFDRNRFSLMDNGSLFISEVHMEDEGKYGCTAGNSGGFRRGEINLVVKGLDNSEAGVGGLGTESENTMTKTIAITLGAAGIYMVLVVGLMIWCRYRRAQRKALMLAQAAAADASKSEPLENGEAVQDIELKARTKPNSAANNTSDRECKKDQEKSSEKSKGISGDHQYCREKLETVMLLGHGEFGQIFLAKAPGIISDDAETVVMVKALEVKNENLCREFQNEIDMFCSMSHSNVAALLGICQENEPFYMIMDYTDWGDLKQFLLATRSESSRKGPKPPPLSPSQITTVCHQVAVGMKYLSEKGFVHKDLATRNCLVSSNLKVTVSKPSLSRDTYAQEYYSYENMLLPLRWIPSEVILEKKWSVKSDVWSFAVLVWEVLTKAEMPFSDLADEEVLQKLQEGSLILNIPETAPKPIMDLLSQCRSNDADRPTFSDITCVFSNLLDSTANT